MDNKITVLVLLLGLSAGIPALGQGLYPDTGGAADASPAHAVAGGVVARDYGMRPAPAGPDDFIAVGLADPAAATGEPGSDITQADRSFFGNALTQAVNLIINLDKELFFIVWTSMGVSVCAVLIASLIAVPLGVIVALKPFPGRSFLFTLLNTLMAMPTVIVGLLLYGLLNRQGLLGDFGLLYTPAAMVVGQSVLIIPIIWNLSITAMHGADPRLKLTCASLGASLPQQGLIHINEVRFALMAAVVAGFGRAIGEVGVAMMLGGNIEGFTRTMTTAIALETGKGEFEFALALGCVLLLAAFIVNMVLHYFQARTE